MRHTRSVEPRAGAYTVFQGDAGEDMHPHRGGGGVAAPHLAEADDVAAVGMHHIHHFGAALHAKPELSDRHGRAVKEIGGGAAHLHVDDAGAGRYVVVDARIDEHQAEAVLLAEEIDAGATLGEMAELLPGDLLRGDGDTLLDHAVVGGEEDVGRLGETRSERLLHEGELEGELLETSEGALGFGEIVDSLHDGRAHGPVGSYDCK